MCLFIQFTLLFSSHLLPADGEDSTVSIQIKLENEGSDEELETDMLYSPQLALKLALTEWLGEFGVPHQYNSKNNAIIIPYQSLCALLQLWSNGNSQQYNLE